MTMRMLTAVTTQLAEELVATERFLIQLDRERETNRAHRTKAINDAIHFSDVADSLETLVVALLAATSSVSLRNRKVTSGATFDMGANTELAKYVTGCVSYLRDNASEGLVSPLSCYETAHVDRALGHLRALFGITAAAILKQATADLHAIRTRGVNDLLAAARMVGQITADDATTNE